MSNNGVMRDVRVPPAPGLPRGLNIPAAELTEVFSHASGPGGQGVNTSDSRVQLSYDVGASATLSERQRERALRALAPRLVGGVLIGAHGADLLVVRDAHAAAGSRSSAVAAAGAAPERLRNPRSRRLLATTDTEENAMAAPASMGLSSPKAASGMAAVL